jgi:hypothetical protein
MQAALRIVAASMIAVVLGVIVGCGESAKVTLAKPGVYKGAKDPLVEKQRDPKQQEALVTRFNLVQTDR